MDRWGREAALAARCRAAAAGLGARGATAQTPFTPPHAWPQIKCLARSGAAGQGGEQLQVWLLVPGAASGSGVDVLQAGWQLAAGPCTALPRSQHGWSVSAAATPSEDGRWLMLLQPRAAAPPIESCQHSWSADTPPLLLAFDVSAGSWGMLQPIQPVMAGGRLPAHNPTVACSTFFSLPPAPRGAAAAAAAAAAQQALSEAPPLQGAASRELGQALRCLRQRCMAAFIDEQGALAPRACCGVAAALYHGTWRMPLSEPVPPCPLPPTADSVVSVWREWAALPAQRLGELADPEPLPYSLRTAQALRAAVAAVGGGSGGGLVIRLAADPSLPLIPCPLSAAVQSGELCRLLEVLGEEAEGPTGAGSSGRGSPPAAREVPLAGVVPEDHAALRQLVGCLAGTTHAGLLEVTLLLDVTR